MFDSEHTIRVVEGPEKSEYDAETDSIWGPLEAVTEPLLRRSEREEDGFGDESGYPTDCLRTPKARASQPAMPTRCPPSPPGLRFRRVRLEYPSCRGLDKKADISKGMEKKSRFIEHVDETGEMLRKLDIPYDEGRRRGIGFWFHSLTRR